MSFFIDKGPGILDPKGVVTLTAFVIACNYSTPIMMTFDGIKRQDAICHTRALKTVETGN